MFYLSPRKAADFLPYRVGVLGISAFCSHQKGVTYDNSISFFQHGGGCDTGDKLRG